MMEVEVATSSKVIFPKLENESIQKSWTGSDEEEEYRQSWSQYRSTEQCKPGKAYCFKVGNPKACNYAPVEWEQERDNVTTTSVDEHMEIIAALTACRINVNGSTLQENSATSNSSPTKRARIVKPPEAFASERRSIQTPRPFSFLAREKENQERRDARRVYYQMLTQKSSPKPFRARPAPKFKPPVLQTPKKVDQKPASVQRVTLKVTENEKSADLQPKNIPNLHQSTKSFLQSPKPVKLSFSSSHYDIPQNFRISTTLSKTKTSSSIVKSKVVTNTAAVSLMQTPTSNNHLAISPASVMMHKPSTVQASKAGQSSQQRRSGTIPKSPQLSTAIRARQRQQFEDMIKEKERQRENVKKMERATIKAYEQEEVARLRKSAVHKPVPIRQLRNVQSQVSKRPLTHPLLPIFVKRPRCI